VAEALPTGRTFSLSLYTVNLRCLAVTREMVCSRVSAEDSIPRALEACHGREDGQLSAPAQEHDVDMADAHNTSSYLSQLFVALADGTSSAGRHQSHPLVSI
jgi:hypothetical protein